MDPDLGTFIPSQAHCLKHDRERKLGQEGERKGLTLAFNAVLMFWAFIAWVFFRVVNFNDTTFL